MPDRPIALDIEVLAALRTFKRPAEACLVLNAIPGLEYYISEVQESLRRLVREGHARRTTPVGQRPVQYEAT